MGVISLSPSGSVAADSCNWSMVAIKLDRQTWLATMTLTLEHTDTLADEENKKDVIYTW